MQTMRAKMRVSSVSPVVNGTQILHFDAVAKSDAYGPDGSDEDNSYARWTPQASCSITVANPALHDKFEAGQKYYVDFTPAAN